MCSSDLLLALIFGAFAFRSRITGVYFSIITQAMTYALMLAFFRNDMGFGGNNGFTDFKRVLDVPITAPGTLPMPPSRMPASPLMSGTSPICGNTRNKGPTSAPPTPASMHPTAKVVHCTRRTGMPTTMAAS